MNIKSKLTKQYIIETIAPIFNKKGYATTTLSDISKLTGLSKGAIYGNFKDKEDLALEVFNHNIKSVIGKIRAITTEIESPVEKLYAITNFYRNYYRYQLPLGGCPILNVGVDSSNNNPNLYSQVRKVASQLQESIANIILLGISKGEIHKNTDAKYYSRVIFSCIEGAIFTSTLSSDDTNLLSMMDHLDMIINDKLKI